MVLKAQSAIEFISVYGFAILLIAIFVGVTAIFISLPKSVIPAQCQFYDGFSCSDTIYTAVAPGAGYQSQILVVAVDSQPGVLHISSFNANLNFGNSISGNCFPSTVLDGETTYCIANFAGSPPVGQVYAGAMNVISNYCANGVYNINNASCASGSSYSFAGFVRAQASSSTNAGFGVSHVPITIQNNQNTIVPAGFQQMVSFNPSSAPYSSYERSNLGNIAFYYGGGQLYSWCESGCTANSANAIFWVKLPIFLTSNAYSQNSLSISMYFLPNVIQYTGIYTGEAPQLSCNNPSNTLAGCGPGQYGEYDNGKQIFNFYDNFAGNTLALWWNTSTVTSVFVGNGIAFTSSVGGTRALTTFINYSRNIVIEGLLKSTGANPTFGLVYSDAMTQNGYIAVYTTNSGCLGADVTCILKASSGTNSGLAVSTSQISSATVYQVESFSVGASTLNSLDNYNVIPLSTSDISYTSKPIGIYAIWNDKKILAQWFRVRDYPPNGAMPNANFGSFVAGS